MTGSVARVSSSKGFIVVDSKKCTGCCSCMLACSLVNEGKSTLSLSRIQVLDDAFGSFPADIDVATCQQCDDPECYHACPEKDEALCIDERTGVRFINESSCTGCGLCVDACRFSPSRIVFDSDRAVAIKCDLCHAPLHWDRPGSPACVEICPVKAIKHTIEKPLGFTGNKPNLRGEGWAKLGLPVD